MKRAEYARIEGYMLDFMSDSAHDKEHIYRSLYDEITKYREDGKAQLARRLTGE